MLVWDSQVLSALPQLAVTKPSVFVQFLGLFQSCAHTSDTANVLGDHVQKPTGIHPAGLTGGNPLLAIKHDFFVWYMAKPSEFPKLRQAYLKERGACTSACKK